MKGEFFHKRKSSKGCNFIFKQMDEGESGQLKRLTNRYNPRQKRRSLPIFSDDIRNSVRESNTEIYFDESKKSKFMKGIVDDYFSDKKDKSAEAKNNEMLSIKNSIRQSVKRGKFYHSSLNQTESEPISAKFKEMDSRNLSQPLSPIHEIPDKLEVIPNTNSLPVSFLPPIHQSTEDNEETITSFPQFSYLSVEVPLKNSSSSSQSDKFLSFQNQAFKVYVVSVQGQPNYRLKQYKPSGMQIMRREERSLKFGVQSIWKESNHNTNTFVSKLTHPLKNLTQRVYPTHDNGNAKFKVKSTNFRKYLLANNCLELKHMIREICLVLKKMEGRILNNKINPSNIFILKGNKVCIGEWGYSSFREEFDIQASKFQSRVHPILKSQKEWLVTPQYLAPQILLAINAKSEADEPDLWEHKSASDIWSLGITLFQILTLIPIWLNDKCLLKTKGGKSTMRCGLLGTGDRNLLKILKKQKKMQKMVGKCLESQVQTEKGEEVSEQVKKMVERMLAFEAGERITVQEILEIVK